MWLKRIALFLGLIFGAYTLLMLVLLIREPAYTWRFLTYPFRRPITTVRWYDPLEKIPGHPRAPLPLHPALRKKWDDLLKRSPKLRWLASSMYFEHPSSQPHEPPPPSKELAPLHPKAQKALDRYARWTRTYALLVLHKNKVIYEHYRNAHHPHALSNSMSMAKTLLAMLVGIAIREKKIRSVDDFAASYLPEWGKDKRSQIRIRHLLQMRSGLRGDGPIRNPFTDVVRLYHTPDIEKDLWKIPLVGEPGQIYDYKDVDSQALGLLLERATKTRYARYLSEKIWKPLGAQDAFVWLDRPQGTAKTTCCIFATARDWARVGQLLLQEGRFQDEQIVPASWIKQMKQPSPFDPDYGFFLWLGSPRGSRQRDRKEPFLANDMIYLDGLFEQRVYVIPSKELVIVRLGENPFRWDDAFLPNTVIRGLRSSPASLPATKPLPNTVNRGLRPSSTSLPNTVNRGLRPSPASLPATKPPPPR
ncbi:MAG: serine hydrolase [Myxococcales bacterium]|nr:serine hydrolase [Myxococcales bacterium]